MPVVRGVRYPVASDLLGLREVPIDEGVDVTAADLAQRVREAVADTIVSYVPHGFHSQEDDYCPACELEQPIEALVQRLAEAEQKCDGAIEIAKEQRARLVAAEQAEARVVELERLLVESTKAWHDDEHTGSYEECEWEFCIAARAALEQGT